MLSELHVQVREIVGRACEDTLAQHGFVPDPIEDPAEDMEGERIQYIYHTVSNVIFQQLGRVRRLCTYQSSPLFPRFQMCYPSSSLLLGICHDFNGRGMTLFCATMDIIRRNQCQNYSYHK